MKKVSVGSFVTTYLACDKVTFGNYCDLHKINIKESEVSTLNGLSNFCPEINFYKFYIGYEIPQLGKEFDLLKINEKEVLNIELKSTATKEEVKTQLKRNLYYLKALEKEMYIATYVEDRDVLYWFNPKTLQINEHTANQQLTNILLQLSKITDEHINHFFDPVNYLISPFNDPERFIKDEYLLTPQQEKFERDIVNDIKNSGKQVISINGSPGTGKTLLLHHITKKLSYDYKLLLIHCSPYLPEGAQLLAQKMSIDIKSSRYLKSLAKNPSNLDNVDILIVDEAQRMYERQLCKILDSIKDTNLRLLLSYDPEQRISRSKLNSNTSALINKVSDKSYKLTGKIRTNLELSSFIRNVFDLSKRHPKIDYKNITLEYFTCSNKVNDFIQRKRSVGWVYIQYTNSRYNPVYYNSYQGMRNDFNTHHAIGQEYDNVIIVIDYTFRYKGNKLISNGNTGGTGYDMGKMLYQHITRVRKKLKIIFLNNEEVYQQVMSILLRNQRMEKDK